MQDRHTNFVCCRTFGEGYDTDWEPGTFYHRYIFWPLSWPITEGAGSKYVAYLNVRAKYGDASNPNRVGGPMMALTLSSGSTNLTIVADNFTAKTLAKAISDNCTSFLSKPFVANATASIKPYDGSPRPENVVQYYRSSSIAFVSSGYINKATYNAPKTPDTDVPRLSGLECFNQTIGNNAPLAIGGERIQAWKIAVFVLSGILGTALLVVLVLTLCRYYARRSLKAQKKKKKACLSSSIFSVVTDDGI